MCYKQSMTNFVAKSPRSPYRRNRNIREIVRPRLPRSIIATARVNLNRYWSRFEELSKENTALVNQMPFLMCSSYNDNEINENLVNEILELCQG